MATLTVISAIASLAAAGATAVGTIAAGEAQQEAANYEAAQLEQEGKQRQAESQLQAQQYRRRKELKLSELQAKAAGSGFSATDPTALALADEISRYGTYQEQIAQFGGRRQRAGLEAQAVGRRLSGKAAAKGARYSAAGTILGGISSFASKYNSPASSSAGGSFRYG